MFCFQLNVASTVFHLAEKLQHQLLEKPVVVATEATGQKLLAQMMGR